MNRQRVDDAGFVFRSRAWEGHIVRRRNCCRLLNERFERGCFCGGCRCGRHWQAVVGLGERAGVVVDVVVEVTAVAHWAVVAMVVV